jgi:nitroreductase
MSDITSITDTIQNRFSCRHYKKQSLNFDHYKSIDAYIRSVNNAPFNSKTRLYLIAATSENRNALRGLGTYGFIKNPSAFIIGASSPSDYHLEDYGYLLEKIILYTTSLGLGTCWLGGTFTKSRFAKQINLNKNEQIPAVVSIGEIDSPQQQRKGLISRTARSHKRLPWQSLFFNESESVPLKPDEVGEFATPLEMVRLAPSASNKQPWRVIYTNNTWRFYLQRTPGYQNDPIKRFLGLCDLQRLDMGIAMCHFDLTTKALGFKGKWLVEETAKQPHPLGQYLASWVM